jgi:predicted DNA-binding ribbon-helix-helix protein
MKSQVAKRSMVIRGHKTSISLEDAFWNGLREIARLRGETVTQLVADIDAERKTANLSSNLRVFVLDHYRNQLSRKNLVDVALSSAEAPLS